MKKLIALAAAAILLAAGCSSPTETDAPRETTQTDEAAGAPAGDNDRGSTTSTDENAPKRTRKRAGDTPVSSDGNSGGAPPNGGDDTGGDGDADGGDGVRGSRGRAPAREPASEGGRSSPSREPSAPKPRAGRYEYAQQGWEELCAGRCDRSDLPPTQRIDQTVSGRPGNLTVVTEAHASNERMVRSTTVFTGGRASIARVELEFDYGFKFRETYDPAPAIQSLRFPLERGQGWSGTWRADTSGDYRVKVLGRERIGDVDTFKLDTLMHFRGDFEGTAEVLVWVDPDTGTPVRTSGKVRLSTQYGRYNSRFDTILIRGPGY